MAMSKVQILSNALALLGKKPILNLDNQSDITTAAEQAFDMLYPTALSEHFWRFATKIEQLSQLVTAPVVSDWQYAYRLPGDFLKTVRMYPQNYAFEIYGDEIYSSLDGPLYLEYIYQVPVLELPYYFGTFMAYEVANYLALSNAQMTQYVNVLGPERATRLAQALAADAQNRPQTPLVSQPIIMNRAVSTTVNG